MISKDDIQTIVDILEDSELIFKNYLTPEIDSLRIECSIQENEENSIIKTIAPLTDSNKFRSIGYYEVIKIMKEDPTIQRIKKMTDCDLVHFRRSNKHIYLDFNRLPKKIRE